MTSKPIDDFESVLHCLEICGKTSSFIVPSLYKPHGDFLSEVLYACGNFASTVRKLYHAGLLLKTLRENTVGFVKKFLETFEVVLECCAYKFGSKRIKWTVILLLQALKLALGLYLTHVRQIVLDERCAPSDAADRCLCGDGDGSSAACQNRPRLAEFLHSGRPLLHACLYVRLGRDSWLPWLASAAVDVLSLICLPSRACLTKRQLERRADWLRAAAVAYAFRTPFHDRFVRPFVAWLASCPLPLAPALFKLVLGYLTYWRMYYLNMWG